MADNNSTSGGEGDGDQTIDSSTAGFLYAAGIGFAIGLVLIFLFCILRTRVPDVFQLRSLLNTWKQCEDYNGSRVGVTEPRPSAGFFGWIRPVFATSEDEVVRKVGLDAAMFLRTIRTSFFLMFVIALFGVILLMPVYGTASDEYSETDQTNKQTGLRIVSLSNVKENSPRFWATVIAEFFVAAVVIFALLMDYKHYSQLRRRYCTSETPINYSLVVYDIPEEERDEQRIRARFEQMVPGQVATVIVIRNPKLALKLQKKLDAAVNKREAAEYTRHVKGVEPTTRARYGALMCFKPKENAVNYWASEQDRLADEVHDLGLNTPPTPSAIVVLSNKRAASLLVQANTVSSALYWHVERAPEPNAINWSAFTMPGYQAELRSIAVACFVFFFTLFWTIPAAAIVGLFSLAKLSEMRGFEWAAQLQDLSPFITGLVEGLLPPVIMSVIISLIPTFFRLAVSQERIASRSRIEVKTRNYFYMFTLYGTFFAFVIGAAFFQDLKQLSNEYSKIIELLALNIPGSGVYYASFVLVQCLVPFPLALSCIVRIIIRFILLKLAKTERQKRKARMTGSLFQFFKYSGGAMLILFLGITYSTLSPLVPACAVIYFGLAYITFRYLLLFTSYQEWDGGGELFPGFYWGTMIGLILKQVVVIAVLGLKKAPAPAAVCLVPTILTICFTFIINKRFSEISEDGSFYDLCTEPAKLDEVPRQYKMVYDQPAGKVTTYENLNGIADVRDVYSEVEYDDSENKDAVHSETLDDSVGYVPDPAANREDV